EVADGHCRGWLGIIFHNVRMPSNFHYRINNRGHRNSFENGGGEIRTPVWRVLLQMPFSEHSQFFDLIRSSKLTSWNERHLRLSRLGIRSTHRIISIFLSSQAR